MPVPASCNTGEYQNSANNECAACNPVCATCTAYSTCQSCQSLNGAAYFLDVSTCTVTCPTGQYGNASTFQCTNCATGCATCFGGAYYQCNSC